MYPPCPQPRQRTPSRRMKYLGNSLRKNVEIRIGELNLRRLSRSGSDTENNLLSIFLVVNISPFEVPVTQWTPCENPFQPIEYERGQGNDRFPFWNEKEFLLIMSKKYWYPLSFHLFLKFLLHFSCCSFHLKVVFLLSSTC